MVRLMSRDLGAEIVELVADVERGVDLVNEEAEFTLNESEAAIESSGLYDVKRGLTYVAVP